MSAAPSSIDARYLRRCLDLAERASGRTRPNPMVGAVVVKGHRVVAEAFHRRAGAQHAEAAALRRAGHAARGSTLYVNLEPCCHFGRTPPCVRAILGAGVGRVVASHRDPFPLVNGRGFAALRRGGVRVRVGVLRAEARRLNEPYLTWVTRGRPYVTVKAGMTMDGRIATSGGESRWITSEGSRSLARRMRSRYDAVMIGSNTARADDPLLTARSGPGGLAALASRQPARVILDSHLRLSARARMLSGRRAARGGRILIFATRSAPLSRERALRARGAEVVRVGSSRGMVDLRAVLKDLARRGITSVLIEGGGDLIGSAFEAAVVDRVVFFAAPVIVGGRKSAPVVGGRGFARLRDGVRLSGMTVRRIGPDFLLEGSVVTRRRG